MSKTKSKQFYDLLKTQQAKTFADFQKAHQAFSENQKANRDQFNKVGRDFVSLVRSYERRLCAGMERTNNSVYSTGVSETYWNLVRQDFPLIDQVGVITK